MHDAGAIGGPATVGGLVLPPAGPVAAGGRRTCWRPRGWATPMGRRRTTARSRKPVRARRLPRRAEVLGHRVQPGVRAGARGHRRGRTMHPHAQGETVLGADVRNRRGAQSALAEGGRYLGIPQNPSSGAPAGYHQLGIYEIGAEHLPAPDPPSHQRFEQPDARGFLPTHREGLPWVHGRTRSRTSYGRTFS